MPVKPMKHGDEWCVEDPDGKVVPGGCHPTRGEAADHAAAINANTEKEAVGETVTSGDVINNTVTTIDTGFSASDSTTWYEIPVLDQESKKKNKQEKSAMDDVYFAESFEDLDAARGKMQEESKIKQLLNDFMTLVGNVFSYPGSAPNGAVKKLAQDLADRLPASPEDMEDNEDENLKEKWTTAYKNDLPDSHFFYVEPGGSKDSEGKTTPRNLRHLPYKDKSGKVDLPHVRNAISRASQIKLSDGSKISEAKANEIKSRAQKILASNTKNVFMLWKQENGEYRWLGIYSNKFRDDDNPAEILSEKAHLNFIDLVEKGTHNYPDLYVWHVPAPIGKADLLAYDDSGFSITSGTIDEDFAIALEKSNEDLAMSHGMPAEYIRRDEIDPTIIVEYVSTEVSVLPRWAAANKMTRFSILKEEEPMAIIPDEKRQAISKLLGEELTLKLEEGLKSTSDKAIAEGIEFKEKQQEETVEDKEVVETTEPVTETEEAVTEPVAEVISEGETVISEEVTTTEEVAEVETKDDAASDDVAGETISKEELATALAAIVEAVQKSNEMFTNAINAMTDRINALEGSMGDIKKEDEDKIAQLASETPEASLLAMLAGKLPASARSVIGTPEARVHGNNNLAKEKPREEPVEPAPNGGGLFFGQWK